MSQALPLPSPTERTADKQITSSSPRSIDSNSGSSSPPTGFSTDSSSEDSPPACATLVDPLLTCRKSKGVRFLIRSESSAGASIFMPMDEAPSRPTFGPASRWTSRQLRMLNVEYEPTHHYSFSFDSIRVSHEIEQRTRVIVCSHFRNKFICGSYCSV